MCVAFSSINPLPLLSIPSERRGSSLGTVKVSLSPTSIASVTFGPPVSPSPSLSILSTALPGVSRKAPPTMPTGSEPNAATGERLSASLDHAISFKISNSDISSCPSSPTKSAQVIVTPTLFIGFVPSFFTLNKRNNAS